MSQSDGFDRFSGTKDVNEAHKFDEARLYDFLTREVDGFSGPMEVRQFKGGQSNPTYQLITPTKKYVLRRKPPGKLLPSAHAVDREYRVMHALHSVNFPVPRTYVLCEDPSIIGTSFFVMDCIDGRILWDGLLPSMSNAERTALYDSMNETIASLHMIDYEAIGLGDYGKPGNYFARQISRWSKQYIASETDEIRAMHQLMEWLPDHIPADESTSIVHGDFRLDNIILHPTEPKVIAVLDWELSTLGHPLADFTYHLMTWHIDPIFKEQSSFRGTDLAALGIPGSDTYVASYCKRTGRSNIEGLDFYLAFNAFRLAAILQGIVGRVRDGTAASAHAKDNEGKVAPLAEQAWAFAQAAGAR